MDKVFNLKPLKRKTTLNLSSMTKSDVSSHALMNSDKANIITPLTISEIDYNKPAYKRSWNYAETQRLLRRWRTLDSNLSELFEEDLKLVQSFYIRFSYLDQSEQALLIKAYHSKEPYNRRPEPLRTQTLLQKIINKLSKFREQPKGPMK